MPGSCETYSRVGVGREALLSVQRGVEARCATQLRIDSLTGLLVKDTVDNTGDVRALGLGENGLVTLSRNTNTWSLCCTLCNQGTCTEMGLPFDRLTFPRPMLLRCVGQPHPHMRV